jgi:hypothetical protein
MSNSKEIRMDVKEIKSYLESALLKSWEDFPLFASKAQAVIQFPDYSNFNNLKEYLERDKSLISDDVSELIEFLKDVLNTIPKPEISSVEKAKPAVKDPNQEEKLYPYDTEWEIHPAANIFPMQTDEEFRGHYENIKEHGLREPVKICNGKIIDGRNRCKACRELKMEIKAVEVELSEAEIENYVFSLNLSRRSLNPGQKAVMALKELDKVEAESKARQLGEAPYGKNSIRGASVEILAKKYSTNAKYIQLAKEIKDKKPEQLQEIFSGAKGITNVHAALKGNTGNRQRGIPMINIPVFMFKKFIEGDCTLEELLPHMSAKAQKIAREYLKQREVA